MLKRYCNSYAIAAFVITLVVGGAIGPLHTQRAVAQDEPQGLPNKEDLSPIRQKGEQPTFAGNQDELQQFDNGIGGFVEPKNPNIRPAGGWYLGVFGNYTTTGHQLTQVFPNTPASRAGLEPGDYIVTVNGSQVGIVNGRRYPIDYLLQRHASANGFVRLLVFDRRTHQLINVDVRLVRGQVHF